MLVHLCEYIKSYWTIYFKWGTIWDVNYISIKLLSKKKKKKKKKRRGSRLLCSNYCVSSVVLRQDLSATTAFGKVSPKYTEEVGK
jgi:hypothetical protein